MVSQAALAKMKKRWEEEEQARRFEDKDISERYNEMRLLFRESGPNNMRLLLEKPGLAMQEVMLMTEDERQEMFVYIDKLIKAVKDFSRTVELQVAATRRESGDWERFNEQLKKYPDLYEEWQDFLVRLRLTQDED